MKEKKFSVTEIEEILKNDVMKYTIEEKCDAWGCVTPHYKDLISAGELLYTLRKLG